MQLASRRRYQNSLRAIELAIASACVGVAHLKGFFGSIKDAEVMRASVYRDVRLEASAASDVNALEAAGVVAPTRAVDHVPRAVGQPEVGEAVIRPDAVDVVDFLGRPRTGRVEPRDAVSIVRLLIQTKRDVAVRGQMARRAAGLDATHLSPPRKQSRLWIVAQKLKQAFVGGSQLIYQCDGSQGAFWC